MFRTHAISFVQLGTFWVITAILVACVAWVALRSIDQPRAGRKGWLSVIGIALQSAGCVAAAIGFTRPVLPWWAPSSLVSTAMVALLGGTAIALFLASVSEMGRNWSLVARTREDHQLIRTGAFAVV